MTAPILSIVGKSNSGKTTLLEKLIPALKRRGLRVATIKHHSHPVFEIDQPGKDTWRHAQAGSDQVILAAPDKIASIRRLERELSLDEIAAQITDVDLILTEGYKRAGKPAVEVLRGANGLERIANPEQLVALVSDAAPPESAIPQFGLEQSEALADWIVNTFMQRESHK
jgi:molybdopterin-guanine dinucleotide biosynthesis protein B